MADKTARRGVSIFIDGKEINNSVKTITNEMKKLRNEQAKMTIGSKEYVAKGKQIAQLKSVMQDHYRDQEKIARQYGVMGKSSQGFFSKLAGGFNKYFAMTTTFIAGLTGASLAFRKLAEDVAKMDDVYSDVMKTTGLTRDQVLALNVEFKKMDTRTSREDLNLLARDAGKLGIEGTQNIMNFVEAGNQIRVSLGEDLGDDAIKNIGKMVGVFEKSTKQLQGIDLKQQMLSVGSAINELGATSTASEPYLVSFAGRMGGISKQAKISMADILGFASSLDQDMQAVEMSATALQKFIMKVMGEPAKFAKMAGMDVKNFSDLLKTDANAAIKAVLRSLNEKGGFQELIPIFKDMGLDGARAVDVLSTLAGSIDQVDAAQRVANQAMSENTSITNEYNIKNENLAAQLEKARKAFKDTALELGESLNPILLKSTKATTYLIRSMVELPKWLKENKKLVFTFVPIMTLYVIIVNRARIANLLLAASEKLKIFWQHATIAATQLQIAVTGYLTGATVAANLATKAFFNTLKLNPYVALGVLLAAVVVGLYKFATSTKRVSAEQVALMEYTASANSELKKENINLEAYRKRLLQTEPNSKERIRLVKELTERYPDLISNIDAEKASVNELDLAIKDYMKNLENTIRLKVLYAKISDKITELEGEKDYGKRAELRKQIDYLKEQYEYQMLINTYGKENAKLVSQQEELLQKESGFKIVSNTMTYEDYAELWKVKNNQNKILYNSQKAESDALNDAYTKYIDENERNKDKLKQVQASLKKIDEIIAGVNKPVEKTKTGGGGGGGEPIEYKEAEKALDRTSKTRQLALVEMRRNMMITEQLHDKLSESETVLALEEKLALQKKYGEDTIDTELALSNAKLKIDQLDIKRAEEHKKALEAMELKGPVEVNEEESMIDVDSYTLAFRFKLLEAFHRDGLLSEREYLEQLAALHKYHDKEINEYLKTERLKNNQQDYDTGIIGRKQYLDNTQQITKEYYDEMFADETKHAEDILTIANAASSFVSTLAESEATAVDNKYAQELNAARKAGKDTTELEEKIEEEKKDIKKKYADIDFAINVARIIAETSLAVMKAAPNIPLQIFTAAAGVAQLALANQQRMAVKNLWTGGFTTPGDKYAPRGVVHAGEFVASQESVNNRHIRPVLDAIDMAQRQGMASSMTNETISRALRMSPQYYDGGFTQPKSTPSNNTKSSASNDGIILSMQRTIDRLNDRLDDGIESYSVISGYKGTRKTLDTYNQLLNNARRKS